MLWVPSKVFSHIFRHKSLFDVLSYISQTTVVALIQVRLSKRKDSGSRPSK